MGKPNRNQPRNLKYLEMIDHTSALPINLLQEILSLLRITDQLCASRASTSWKSAWDSLPNLDFDEDEYNLYEDRIQGREVYIFDEFVDNHIQRIHKQRVNLQSFKLHMTHYDDNKSASVDRWIKLLPKNSLKFLQLSFCKNYIDPEIAQMCFINLLPKSSMKLLEIQDINPTSYELPFSSLPLSSLNFLSVKGCKIYEFSLGDTIEFGNLKALSLDTVYIQESMLHKIISRCPMIADLKLISCCGIKNLRISTLPNFTSLTIHFIGFSERSSVDINSSTLQSYYYHDTFLRGTDNLTCINLVDLTLKTNCVEINEKELQFLISKLPLLSTLALDFRYGLRIIRISSPKLKTLKIRQVFHLQEADIQAPSLEALEISLSLEDQDHLKSMIAIDADKLQKIELNIETSNYFVEVYNTQSLELRNFLKQFVHKTILSLKNEHCIQVRWNPCQKPKASLLKPVAIEHLNLNISKQIPWLYEDLLKGLFWNCHPRSLSLRVSWDVCKDKDSMKKLFEIIKTAEDPIMSNSFQSKCWRDYMKSYQIRRAHDGKIIDYKDFLKSAKWRYPAITEISNLVFDFHFLWARISWSRRFVNLKSFRLHMIHDDVKNSGSAQSILLALVRRGDPTPQRSKLRINERAWLGVLNFVDC
ncbi:hypothetical protein ACFE04_003983 [Oxalis oulophora]